MSRTSVKLMMREGLREPFAGDVLTIGRQDVYLTVDQLLACADDMGYALDRVNVDLASGPEPGRRRHLTDVCLFQSLGFRSLQSLDASSYEECTICHDLNQDVPIDLHGRYDLIFDGGTSEHVFNLPKVLENYYRLLRVGGRLIHELPCSNYVDHGFYMFSPGLFADYYSANGWSIEEFFFIRHSSTPHLFPAEIYRYSPGSLDRYSFGGLGGGMFVLHLVVKKTPQARFDAPVQQGSYQKLWRAAEGEGASASSDRTVSWRGRLVQVLPAPARDLLTVLFRLLLPHLPLRLYLPLVARY